MAIHHVRFTLVTLQGGFRWTSLDTGSAILSSKWNLLKMIPLYSDGHCSHARNLDLRKLGREHHDSVIFLFPYLMHKMQFLDLSFGVAFEDILCSWNGTVDTETWWKICDSLSSSWIFRTCLSQNCHSRQCSHWCQKAVFDFIIRFPQASFFFPGWCRSY
jgi:hypothetical protein